MAGAFILGAGWQVCYEEIMKKKAEKNVKTSKNITVKVLKEAVKLKGISKYTENEKTFSFEVNLKSGKGAIPSLCYFPAFQSSSTAGTNPGRPCPWGVRSTFTRTRFWS